MKRLFRFIGKLFIWSIILSVGLVVLFKYVPVPMTPLMGIRYFESTEESKTWKHDWVSIDNISKNMQLAVICSEDQKFLEHNGFDIEAIEKAYEHNREGKRIRGGSTISQQTAKNVFLWPNRSWLRKGLEVYFTFLIETIWSKERILEVYLNSIEMGPGVYGVEAASQHWFKKSSANLTAYEAAAIVSILPNPRKYRANPASTYIQKRKEWIVKQMRFYGEFDLNK
ncbi:monofunctional biosynthetic peptidoglycan transglycosylase [Winogradskyella thalassocola]|uniref:Biosynthetic peptidoglycan transglycosylase n=1 Tax=Winogradskyella thalassocola TaxID=262004 RepID=A0A1G7X4S6_9FLAO|nr:monofunctional biosynthetic peptidoglycan transglycosylase [Winogradskyella thalassocola]SDG79204.1 monofunctional biosynthetic peptidoglycan transglycosylase [Winogradskyella thalassocola]